MGATPNISICCTPLMCLCEVSLRETNVHEETYPGGNNIVTSGSHLKRSLTFKQSLYEKDPLKWAEVQKGRCVSSEEHLSSSFYQSCYSSNCYQKFFKKTKGEVRYLCLGCKICFCDENQIFQVKKQDWQKKGRTCIKMFKFILVTRKS